MSDQLEKLLAQKPMKKPAMGWRNWWLQKRDWTARDGTISRAGEVGPGNTIWPSKDIAETRAEKWFAETINGHDFSEYLGAFPEGERP